MHAAHFSTRLFKSRDGRVARPHDAGPELKPRFYGSPGQLLGLFPGSERGKKGPWRPDKTERAEIDPEGRRKKERGGRMQEEIQNHVERRGKKGVAYERLRVHNGALGAGG